MSFKNPEVIILTAIFPPADNGRTTLEVKVDPPHELAARNFLNHLTLSDRDLYDALAIITSTPGCPGVTTATVLPAAEHP